MGQEGLDNILSSSEVVQRFLLVSSACQPKSPCNQKSRLRSSFSSDTSSRCPTVRIAAWFGPVASGSSIQLGQHQFLRTSVPGTTKGLKKQED